MQPVLFIMILNRTWTLRLSETVSLQILPHASYSAVHTLRLLHCVLQSVCRDGRVGNKPIRAVLILQVWQTWDGWGISFAPQILTPDISDKLRRLPSQGKVAPQHMPLLTQIMHTLSDLRYADDLAQSAKAALVQQQLGVF